MNTKKCPQCGTQLDNDAPEGLCPACLMKAGLESGVVAGGDDPGRPASPPPATANDETKPSNNTFAPPPGMPLGIDEVRKLFPQLEIIEQVGRGGMGVVYKARQPQLDRIVALKILPAELAKTPGFAERFSREARALAKLNHPNIVSVFDFGNADGLFYFVMEFVDGANLRQMIGAKQITPDTALAIVPKVCEALQFAHDEGILHRDIKPENILIDKKGRVKIADFGLAKLTGASEVDLGLTNTGMSMGTPRYMAPEQFENTKTVDHRADIYSLGVVFYEMLTGEIPTGRFALPSQRVQVDVRIDEVVLRSLEHEPAQRYQHVSEVKTGVEDVTLRGERAVGPALVAEPPSPARHAASGGPAASPPPATDIFAQAKATLQKPALGMLLSGLCLMSWAGAGFVRDTLATNIERSDAPASAIRTALTCLFYSYGAILLLLSANMTKNLRGASFPTLICWMAMLLPFSLLFLRNTETLRMLFPVVCAALAGFAAWRALRKPDIISAFAAARSSRVPIIGKNGGGKFQSLEKRKFGFGLRGLLAAGTGLVLPVVFVIAVSLASTNASAQSPRETLSKEALNASAWAVATLDVSVPPDIRRNLAYLREDLLDEAKANTNASAVSFKLGTVLCDKIIDALDEHDQTAVRAGYRAAQADANTRVTSQALEARRNYKMSWPQFAREQAQRSEIQRQQTSGTALVKESVKVDWATRATSLRNQIDGLYMQYRQALRSDPTYLKVASATTTPQVPAQPNRAVSPSIPTTPTPVGTPVPGGADITITPSYKVEIVPLEVGQQSMYRQNGTLGHPFTSLSQVLSGWQFVRVHWHQVDSYEVRVNQDGFLYVFGGGSPGSRTAQQWLGTEEISKWEPAKDAIPGEVNLCYRRKVSAGEAFTLTGMALQLAAKSIHLVQPAGDKKVESATQPTAPVPTPAVVAPATARAPVGNAGGAAITIFCSSAVRILPLEVGQQTFDHSQKFPSDLIEGISPELSGWQYVPAPMNEIGWYEIHVNQDGVLFIFGCRNKHADQNCGEEISKWGKATGAVQGGHLDFSLQRKVVAGEIIKLKAFHLLIAAKSIELVRDGKAESATQPSANATSDKQEFEKGK